jgi:hypothetical protein
MISILHHAPLLDFLKFKLIQHRTFIYVYFRYFFIHGTKNRREGEKLPTFKNKIPQVLGVTGGKDGPVWPNQPPL